MSFNNYYSNWRVTRIRKILSLYGCEFFNQKTVLELGSGHGDIGAFFYCLGADVTCSDARQENLEVVQERHPYLKTVQADLDTEYPFEHFDVIIHFGVLYHLEDFKQHLIKCCKNCDHLILDTAVADSTDPNFVMFISETSKQVDQAFNGVGSRAGQALIEKIIKSAGMVSQRHDDPALNSDFHTYSWEVKDTSTWHNGQRRFWTCRKPSEQELFDTSLACSNGDKQD